LQQFKDEYVKRKAKCPYQIYTNDHHTVTKYLDKDQPYKAKKMLILMLAQMQTQYLVDRGAAFIQKLSQDYKQQIELNQAIIEILKLPAGTQKAFQTLKQKSISVRKQALFGYIRIMQKYF
jgi:hypothetical protein